MRGWIDSSGGNQERSRSPICWEGLGCAEIRRRVIRGGTALLLHSDDGVRNALRKRVRIEKDDSCIV